MHEKKCARRSKRSFHFKDHIDGGNELCYRVNTRFIVKIMQIIEVKYPLNL